MPVEKRNWELPCNGHRVSVMQDGKVLETGGECVGGTAACTTTPGYSVPPTGALRSVQVVTSALRVFYDK